MTATQQLESRPTAAFVLSLLAGIFILLGTGLTTVIMNMFASQGPYGMMNGYYPGMMGGYYGMMHGLGFGGGWFYWVAALGLVSGAIIVVSAVMLNNQPAKASLWGTLILTFSIVSLAGMGGFFLGATLGLIGGVLALTWRP